MQEQRKNQCGWKTWARGRILRKWHSCLIHRLGSVPLGLRRAWEEMEFALKEGGKLNDLMSVFKKIPLLTLWRMNSRKAEVQQR